LRLARSGGGVDLLDVAKYPFTHGWADWAFSDPKRVAYWKKVGGVPAKQLGLAVGEYAAWTGAQHARRTPLLRGIFGTVGKTALKHGLTGRTARIPVLGTLAFAAGPAMVSGYQGVRDAGKFLSKIAPAERIRLLKHDLATDISKSRYLRNAPITGDAKIIIDSLTEKELYKAAPSKLFTKPDTAWDLPRGAYEGIGMAGRGAKFALGVKYPGAPMTGIWTGDITAAMRYIQSKRVKQPGVVYNFLKGLAGHRPHGPKDFSRKWVYSYYMPDIQQFGFDLRREFKRNPALAKKIYEDLANIGIEGTVANKNMAKFVRGVNHSVRPANIIDLAESIDKNPKLLKQLDNAGKKEFNPLLQSLAVRGFIGMPAEKNLPTAKEYFGHGKKLVGDLFRSKRTNT
jgi:hypothetical protein